MRQRYAYVANKSTQKLARTTWLETHRPGGIIRPRDKVTNYVTVCRYLLYSALSDAILKRECN